MINTRHNFKTAPLFAKPPRFGGGQGVQRMGTGTSGDLFEAAIEAIHKPKPEKLPFFRKILVSPFKAIVNWFKELSLGSFEFLKALLKQPLK